MNPKSHWEYIQFHRHTSSFFPASVSLAQIVCRICSPTRNFTIKGNEPTKPKQKSLSSSTCTKINQIPHFHPAGYHPSTTTSTNKWLQIPQKNYNTLFATLYDPTCIFECWNPRYLLHMVKSILQYQHLHNIIHIHISVMRDWQYFAE